MHVKSLESLVVHIICDCGAENTKKRFLWRSPCFACGKEIPVSEMTDQYKTEQGMMEHRGPGRPRKPREPKVEETPTAIEPVEKVERFTALKKPRTIVHYETPQEKSQHAQQVIDRFKKKYGDVSEAAKKYSMDRQRRPDEGFHG